MIREIGWKGLFMNYHLDGLEKGLKSFGLSLSEEQKSQFITYYEMLIENLGFHPVLFRTQNEVA